MTSILACHLVAAVRRVARMRFAERGCAEIAQVLATASLCLTINAANAQGLSATQDDRADSAIALEVGVARYTSIEPLVGGGVFNSERGSLRALGASAYRTIGPWRVEGRWVEMKGTLDYVGQTQFGLPITTQTRLDRHNLRLSIDRSWPLPPQGAIARIGIGLERVRTWRDIQPSSFTGRLTETLHTSQGSLGATAMLEGLVLGCVTRFSVSGQLLLPFEQTLDVDTHGIVDQFQLRPGKQHGSRFGLRSGWALGQAAELQLGYEQETYRPGASAVDTVYRDGRPAGLASYPGSTQRLKHLSAALTWSF